MLLSKKIDGAHHEVVQTLYKTAVAKAMTRIIKSRTDKSYLIEFAEMLSAGSLEDCLLEDVDMCADPEAVAIQVWRDTAEQWRRGEFIFTCKSVWWAMILSNLVFKKHALELLTVIEKL